jgi:hypothetical protein
MRRYREFDRGDLEASWVKLEVYFVEVDGLERGN